MESEIVVAGITEPQSVQQPTPLGSDSLHESTSAAEHRDDADDLVVLERLEADLAEIDRELQALNATPNA